MIKVLSTKKGGRKMEEEEKKENRHIIWDNDCVIVEAIIMVVIWVTIPICVAVAEISDALKKLTRHCKKKMKKY